MKTNIILLFFFTCIQFSFAQTQKISILDYGVQPNSRKPINDAFAKAIAATGGQNAIIDFPKGRYDFWQDYSEASTIGMVMHGLKNITIEGNGSEFIYHGMMQIANIQNCENITLQNFSVDWDRPYITQGEFIAVSDNYVDLKIDKTEYPFIIENERIRFIGEGWSVLGMPYNCSFSNVYLPNGDLPYKTRDGYVSPGNSLFDGKAKEISSGVVRFYGIVENKPEIGWSIGLSHGKYLIPGIESSESKDLVLRNLNLYHTLSHAVYGFRVWNLTMDNVNVTTNKAKKRLFSSVSDASHFTNCGGTILIDGCSHAGHADDFTNIHGAYTEIVEIINTHTLRTCQKGAFIKGGDQVWFIHKDNVQRDTFATVQNVKIEKTGENTSTCVITFKDDISDMPTRIGDFLENKTWCTNLIVRNSKILKKNRARGILVTTPSEVLIENNYFNSAGAAILIEGDLDHWYESGATRNVTIRNNVFENCNTSGCETGDRWEWGEAPITISPSHRPNGVNDVTYHKNITITNNTFKCFDAPVVFARSVNHLMIQNNNLIHTSDYKPFLWQKSNFYLDGCRNVTIKWNKIDPNFIAKSVEINNMKRGDIKIDKSNKLRLLVQPLLSK